MTGMVMYRGAPRLRGGLGVEAPPDTPRGYGQLTFGAYARTSANADPHRAAMPDALPWRVGDRHARHLVFDVGCAHLVAGDARGRGGPNVHRVNDQRRLRVG